ncbi:hypothetical protein, partial [Vibrio breoganii]|uniref:hypothetical protein n=1 Tax=Vibrio breoganii TaxID=553239 RepID=UPI001A7E11D6
GNLKSSAGSRPSIGELEGDVFWVSECFALILSGFKLQYKRTIQNTPSFPSAFIGNLKNYRCSRPSIEALEGDVFWGFGVFCWGGALGEQFNTELTQITE